MVPRGEGKDPGIQRFRLQRALKKMRIHRKLTQKEVAEALYWSPSKLLRIESGKTGISVTDLMALLRHYGVEDRSQVGELVEMARLSRFRSWSMYQDVLAPQFLAYLEYEGAASTIRQFELAFVPGLLQVAAYAERVITELSGTDAGAHKIERMVQARVERSSIFDGADTPEVRFVLDESVLLRAVADGQGKDIARAQLSHLLGRAGSANIRIQVLPLSAGPHAGLSGPFVILEFDEEDPILYLETAHNSLISKDDVETTASYLETFAQLESKALSPEDSIELMGLLLRNIT